MASLPGYLLLEITGEHARQVEILRDAATTIRRGGGRVLGWGAPGQVASLEPGAPSGGLVLARWSDPQALRRVARDQLLPQLKSMLPPPTIPTLLAVEGLPDNGLPEMLDIPTVASVPPPKSMRGTALLIIRGRAWDPAALDRYRDVILPMHKERAGYYEAFAVAPGQVEALSGEWSDLIFAVSRWPSAAVAEDFWYSERYQTVAIPMRLGAGKFSVHMLRASDE
jgi:uncharacterized protein (DUF1330 family)